jgi:predicted DNA-binding protein (MmcQ/YjbR family)
MTAAALRRWCLERIGATEEFPFGEGVSVFKVAGKMFALSSLDSRPLTVSLKCEPDLAERLRATYPAVAPGYHLNKRHWNTVTLDGSLPDEMSSTCSRTPTTSLWLACRPPSGGRSAGLRVRGWHNRHPMRFLRMKPGHGELLLAEGDPDVREDEERLIEEFRRQLDEGMWAAVPTTHPGSGRREAVMIKQYGEIPPEADRVIFFPRASGG